METTLRARLHMYAPGQPMARELAKNPTVLMVNDTLFAHGGVLPHHGAPRAPLPLRLVACSLPLRCPSELRAGRAARALYACSFAAPTRPR